MGENQETSSSAEVLLQLAYFLESEQSKDLANLLQRSSIIIAANAALIGLWGNVIFQLIPRLKMGICIKYIIIGALLIPLFLLASSLLLSALAMRYRSFKAPDPEKLFTKTYIEGPSDKITREIAISYGKFWTPNRQIIQTRTKRLNAGLILLLVAAGWIVITLSVIAFLPLGGR